MEPKATPGKGDSMTETLSLLEQRNGDRRPAGAVRVRPTREDLEMIDRTRAARDLLASKWKVDLLYLLARGVQRYSRVYDNLKGASKKTLTHSRRRLESGEC